MKTTKLTAICGGMLVAALATSDLTAAPQKAESEKTLSAAGQIREVMRVGHIEQVRTIIDKLKAIPERKGTMFDHTVIIYFPENGEGHHSHGFEAPFIVLGGDKCALNMLGRYIRLPYHGTEGHKTIGNWYTTLLNAHGNPIEHYGDYDLEMSRRKLDQKGAIKQLLT